MRESGSLGRFNVTWDISDTKLLYATYSEGYRPGGINRRGTVPPYMSDYLKNYEFGWKTMWLDKRLAWNGAVFRQNWDDFQFSYLGANGLTEIRNAGAADRRPGNGSAVGDDLQLHAHRRRRLLRRELSEDYCGYGDLDGNPISFCPPGSLNPTTGEINDIGPQAVEGDRLPITPRFKGNLTGRYTWDVGEYEAYAQGALFHVGDRTVDLRDLERGILGDPSSTTRRTSIWTPTRRSMCRRVSSAGRGSWTSSSGTRRTNWATSRTSPSATSGCAAGSRTR